MTTTRRLRIPVMLLCVLSCTSAAHGADTTSWRFTHSMALTGPEPQPPADKTGLAGSTAKIGRKRFTAPPPFSCDDAKWEVLQMPAEGLFEGGLPAPHDRSAQALGIAKLPATVHRVTCSNAGFDFVEADDVTLLTALDHRVWSLSKTPGAHAGPDSPAGVVQALLEAHFSADRGFLPPLLANKTRWLSSDLLAAIATYFARTRPQDEVPPIDGDAFTDAQEPPTRFAVGKADVDGKKATVPVRVADAFSTRRLDYRLVKEGEAWKVDDIRTEAADDRGLRDILEKD